MSGYDEDLSGAPGEPEKTPAGDEQEQPPTDAEAAELPAEAHEPVMLAYSEYEELVTLAKERDDYLKRLQRAVADYQNLQRRVDKSRATMQDAILKSLAEEIVPVADGLARALEVAEALDGAEGLVAGLRLVERQFYEALARFGVRPMEPVGQTFDPHYHEAAMQQEAAGVAPNTVIKELKKGFMLGDVVIRPSQVVVAAAPPGKEQQCGAEPPDEAEEEE